MPFHIHNVLDFGTTEPWVARLWLGIFQFRDFVDTGTKRLAFGNFMVTENIDTQMSHRRTCEDNDLVGEVTREAKD